MPKPRPLYYLTRKAAEDIVEIAEFTIAQFGVRQARRYRDGLEETFGTLAAHPLRGRAATDLAPGLRRYPFKSHVVFFRSESSGILIVRVLHKRMDAPRHSMLSH